MIPTAIDPRSPLAPHIAISRLTPTHGLGVRVPVDTNGWRVQCGRMWVPETQVGTVKQLQTIMSQSRFSKMVLSDILSDSSAWTRIVFPGSTSMLMSWSIDSQRLLGAVFRPLVKCTCWKLNKNTWPIWINYQNVCNFVQQNPDLL